MTKLENEHRKLEDTEKGLSTKGEQFCSMNEAIKAQYQAAEAQVRIKEIVAGISEEMSDKGMAMDLAEAKKNKIMRAMSNVLTDFTSTREVNRNLIQSFKNH